MRAYRVTGCEKVRAAPSRSAASASGPVARQGMTEAGAARELPPTSPGTLWSGFQWFALRTHSCRHRTHPLLAGSARERSVRHAERSSAGQACRHQVACSRGPSPA
eukprot:scaffold388_cov380-Prasinococcus_capsulatus_cf.AAC.3